MTFRRPERDGVNSARWLTRNKSALCEFGIPTEVVSTERTWNYVLLHGDDEFGCGWNAEWLTAEQAQNVLRLIQNDLRNETGYDLIPRLRSIASTSNSSTEPPGAV